FLSTSSTAYAMMGAVLAVYALYRLDRVMPEGRVVKKTVPRKVLGWIEAGLAALLVMLLDNHLATKFLKMIDTLIFQKQNTSSYIERSSWTSAALDGFFQSSGLGLGVGSV